MLIRILFSDWSISIQVPSKLKKNRMHFYSIQVRSSFLIQVSCMVCTIKKLEFKKLEWRLACKTCIVYTGLNCPFSDHNLNIIELKTNDIEMGHGSWIMNLNAIKSNYSKQFYTA